MTISLKRNPSKSIDFTKVIFARPCSCDGSRKKTSAFFSCYSYVAVVRRFYRIYKSFSRLEPSKIHAKQNTPSPLISFDPFEFWKWWFFGGIGGKVVGGIEDFPIYQALGCCLCLRGKPLETWLGTTPLEWKVLFVRALLAYSVLCHLDKFKKIGNEQLAVVISCFSTCFGSCSCFVQHVSNLVAKRWRLVSSWLVLVDTVSCL